MKTNFIFFVVFIGIFTLKVSAKSLNVNNYGIYGKLQNETKEEKYERWKKIKKVFEYCVKNKIDMFFPEGIYDVGERNFPFRTPDNQLGLLDCNNINVYGVGEKTLFMTSSASGADVLQLNKVKNFTIKNISITAELSAYNHSGANGISITNGWDNIILQNIKCYDLPGVDKGFWIDGGKALTIQYDTDVTSKKGKIKATGIKSINNAYGFRFDGRYVDEILRWNPYIDIDMKVERSFQGISIAFGNSSRNRNVSDRLHLNIVADIINSQQSVVMARVVGGKYNFKIKNDLSKIDLNLNAKKVKWLSDDSDTFVYLAQAPKNIQLALTGNVDDVDKIIWMGAIGHVDEPFNFENLAENNSFNFDIKTNVKNKLVLIENNKKQSIENTSFILNGVLENSFKILKNKSSVKIKKL